MNSTEISAMAQESPWYIEIEFLEGVDKEIPMSSVVKETASQLWQLFAYWVFPHIDRLDLSEVSCVVIDEATDELVLGCDIAVETGIGFFMRFTKTIRSYRNSIVAFFRHNRQSIAVIEGLNSKSKIIRKKVSFFSNQDNFINMIYFVAGKGFFNYPRLSLLQ